MGVAQAFEGLGTLILAVGVVWSFVLAVLAWRQSGSGKQAYTVLRQAFGGTLLLALEILVAADLIRTVAVSPTLDNVLVLGLIVLIRTFLSFSLEMKLKALCHGGGHWPADWEMSSRPPGPRSDQTTAEHDKGGRRLQGLSKR